MLASKIQEIVNQRKKTLKLEQARERKNRIKYSVSPKRKSLRQSIEDSNDIAIISEIKPASPTLGQIKESLNVKELSKEMENAGAIGLSVLTEPNYFYGSYKNLSLAIENTSLPCLMKDFIIDEFQIRKAAQLGASNVLLINSIINLQEFYAISIEHNLEPLIEIHEEREIEDIKDLIEIGYHPKLIGVNNRNLTNLKINLETSHKLIPRIKKELGEDLRVISESGIQSYEEILKLQRSGADAFLIGTLIMQSNNMGEIIGNLRGKGRDRI